MLQLEMSVPATVRNGSVLNVLKIHLDATHFTDMNVLRFGKFFSDAVRAGQENEKEP